MNAAQMAVAQRALAEALDTVPFEKDLAAKIGVSRQAVNHWKVVPPYRVLAVEAATGISRTRLRPDLYPEALA